MGVVDNISTELTNIRDATYGEQVRGSIHDGIKKIAEEVDASEPTVVRRALTEKVYSSDTSVHYNVGDYVMYPNADTGALYICQTATTGGQETFPGGKWLKVGLADEIADRVEYNNYRFDSVNGPEILAGKSCNDLTKASVWFVNKVDGVSTLTDFPIDGPGWIRVTVTNQNRIMQEVYPSKIEDHPYRLARTRYVDGATSVWSDWWKIPYISEDARPAISVDGTELKFNSEASIDIGLIDRTLSISGKAADAKVTGDEIAKIKPHTFKRPFRFIHITDTHYGYKYWYRIRGEERMARVIKWVNEENNVKPVDFILHTGDVTYQNGFDPTVDINYLKRFSIDVASRFPCPVYMLPGNHDGYLNGTWTEATGTPRQYIVEHDDFVLAMLDTFAETDPQESTGELRYTGGDAEFLSKVIEKAGDRPIIVAGHYFNRNSDSSEFKDLIDNTTNIIFMVCGHVHNPASYMNTYGNKPLIIGGHAAFGMNNGIVQDYSDAYAPGYGIFELTDAGLTYEWIRPSETYYLNNTSTTTTVSTENVNSYNIELDPGFTYELDADFHVVKDSPSNKVNTLLSSETRKVIYANDDLNDLIELGEYYCTDTTIAGTLSNLPNQSFFALGGFRLVVENNTQDNTTASRPTWRRQLLYPVNDGAFVYVRRIAVPNEGETEYGDWQAVRFGSGETISETLQESIVLAHATYSPILSVTLEPGAYILSGIVRFPFIATGRRTVNISATSGGVWAPVSVTPVLTNNDSTSVQFVITFNPTSTTTYYLNAYQNNDNNETMTITYATLSATRIG